MSAARDALAPAPAVMSSVPKMAAVLRGSFEGVHPGFILSASVCTEICAAGRARDLLRSRRAARACARRVRATCSPSIPAPSPQSAPSSLFQFESAEKTIVFDLMHMRSIISAGDYRGFHDYVRSSATTYFDYSIPAWFGAMLLWVWFHTLRLRARRWPPRACSKVKALALRRQLVRLRAQVRCNGR